MKCVGITSPRDIAILLNIGPEYLEFLFERIESRWTIKIKTTIENEENFFLFEKQRGGARLFSHLDLALNYALSKAPKIEKGVIRLDDDTSMNFTFNKEGK